MKKVIFREDYSSIHSICHILTGMISIKFPFLWYLLILPYQLSQYIFNCRFFINKWKILKNNSIHHTIYKLSEYTLGMLTSIFIVLVKTLLFV